MWSADGDRELCRKEGLFVFSGFLSPCFYGAQQPECTGHQCCLMNSTFHHGRFFWHFKGQCSSKFHEATLYHAQFPRLSTQKRASWPFRWPYTAADFTVQWAVAMTTTSPLWGKSFSSRFGFPLGALLLCSETEALP